VWNQKTLKDDFVKENLESVMASENGSAPHEIQRE
jgi:hypothetical protein